MSDIDASLIARMRTEVAALPWAQQRVFVLHAVEGMDYAAIAERLVITVPEVDGLLAAALVRLEGQLSGDGVDKGPL